jgi:ElaB/YqjD/DUF883 family membrane-anchored ribosome-binding protein
MATAKPTSMEQFRETTHALREDVQKLGRISKDMAQETMGHLRENASDYYKQGMEKAQNLEQGFEAEIQKHPLRSVLIAAGIGLLVGAIWKKK